MTSLPRAATERSLVCQIFLPPSNLTCVIVSTHSHSVDATNEMFTFTAFVQLTHPPTHPFLGGTGLLQRHARA